MILGVMAVGLVGAGVFLFSREAAAKSGAQKAFVVDPNCGSILVVDEAAAKKAVIAASIVAAPTPDSSAIAALRKILSIMFPGCDWENPLPGLTFVRGNGQSMTWKDIETIVGDKTVLELKELVEPMQGQAAIALPFLVQWGFGTGGCSSCRLPRSSATLARKK